jgi:hypothetical protein
MGKLHTLRRAIERNPEQWRGRFGPARRAYYCKRDKRWEPRGYWGPRSYRSFIEHVLAGVGNADVGRGEKP